MAQLLVWLFVTELLIWGALGLFIAAILWALLDEARRLRRRRLRRQR